MKIKYTKQFKKWLFKKSNLNYSQIILRRIDDIKLKNHFGDHKKLDNDLYELRFFIGSGIRIYFTLIDLELVILLIGGDKSTQVKDIQKAKNILKELK